MKESRVDLEQLEKAAGLHKRGIFAAFELGLVVGRFGDYSLAKLQSIIQIFESFEQLVAINYLAKEQKRVLVGELLTIRKDSLEQFKKESEQIIIQHDGSSSILPAYLFIFECLRDKDSKGGVLLGSNMEDQRKNYEKYLKSQQEEQQSLLMAQKMQAEFRQQFDKKKVEEEKQSELAAKKLEQQLAEGRRRDKQKEEEVECMICSCQLYEDSFFPLYCGHVFHKACLNGYLKTLINEKKFPLKCPMDKCGGEVYDSDLKELVEPALFQKFIQFSLKYFAEMNNDSVSWCPTPNCPFMFSYEEEMDYFRCPKCLKQYCLKCKSDYHRNMTCAEYRVSKDVTELDRIFDDFVKGSKFKVCPGCKIWVEKVVGCDSMSCRCGCFFCYNCGGQLQYDHAPCPCANQPQPVPMIRPHIRPPRPVPGPKLPRRKR